MKRRWAPALAFILVLAIPVPPAQAYRGDDHHDRGHHGGGCVGCGFVGGLVVGGALGALLGAPYAVAPPTYAYTPPPPACYTRPGYWSQAPVVRPDGLTTYQRVWVPPQTVCS